MVPKSERFELRLDENTLAEIDIWRSEQPDQPTRSEAVRKLIAEGLSRDVDRQLFQIARLNLLTAAKTKGVGDEISDAYIYAWQTGVFPLFDDSSSNFHRAFTNNFDVSGEMVDDLSKLLDDRERDGNVPSFYELEDYYMGRRHRSKWSRGALICACRYMFLREMWDENFWSELLRGSDHPTEAKSIIRKFDRHQAIFLP